VKNAERPLHDCRAWKAMRDNRPSLSNKQHLHFCLGSGAIGIGKLRHEIVVGRRGGRRVRLKIVRFRVTTIGSFL
jgi:hypothetical protein